MIGISQHMCLIPSCLPTVTKCSWFAGQILALQIGPSRRLRCPVQGVWKLEVTGSVPTTKLILTVTMDD